MRIQRIVHPTYGYTLIEVLLTLWIIGILVGIGVPVYGTQIPKYRLHAAARQILSDLLIARKRAMSEGHVVQLLFRHRQSYVIWQDQDNNRRINAGESTVKEIARHGIILQSTNHPRFHPTGTVTNLPTITLHHPSNPKRFRTCLSISIAGRIKQSKCKKSG